MGAFRVIPSADLRDSSGPALTPVVEGVAVLPFVPRRRAAHPHMRDETPSGARPRGWVWVGFDDEGGRCALL